MNARKIILLTTFCVVMLTSLLPQNIYILVFFSILALGLLPYRKWWDGICWSLMLFSICYTVMVILSGQMKSGFAAISYLISPVAFYRFGHYLMAEYRTDDERYRLLLYMTFAYLLNVIVLTFVDIAVVGIINEDRTLLGTSTEDDSLAATLYGLMASVGIGCVGACFAKGQKIVIRLLYSILVIFSSLTVIHLVNRGGLVILVTCLVCSILINYKRNLGKLFLVGISLIIGVYVLFNYGILSEDILDAYQNRNEVRGYDVASAGGRTDLWMMSIGNLFRYPLGWKQYSYAHNLWLDMARIGGWISLLPFLIVTIMIVRKMFSLYRTPISSFGSTLVVFNMALISAASIEPVIEGSMLFFALLMMAWGMISHIIIERKLSNNEEDYNIK